LRIKICGITRLEDAVFVSRLGVWALGFIFVPQSPRAVHISKAEEITKILDIYCPSVVKVGVFANSDEKTIKEVASRCSLDVIQFHGKEPPELTKRFSTIKFKAFIIDDEIEPTNLIEAVDRYEDCIPLLDLPKDKDVSFDTLLRTAYILKKMGKDFILAGGIGIENIKDVVDLDPYAIDIARGVEVIPGIKDREKLEKIVDIVKKEGREYV
jgi:phosphoribosylanthranilate isomerase